MHVMTKEEYDKFMEAHAANARVDMSYHDRLPWYVRLKHYSGSDLGRKNTDLTWNRSNQQAREPRYKLSPAMLRRLGIGR